MAKAQKSSRVYAATMGVWLAQKDAEIASCKRNIRRLRQKIQHHREEATHALKAITLEEVQIRLARKDRAGGKKDLASYLRTQGRKAKK